MFVEVFSRRKKLAWLVMPVVMLGVISCGSDDDDESDGGARVVDVRLDTNPVSVGQGSIAHVDFSFSSDDIFDDDQNVVVVVHLPNSVQYRLETAEIDRETGEDRDVGAQVFACNGGDAYLVFDLDEDDLATASNPSGDADAELKFTIDGVRTAGAASIEAIARNNTVNFSCETGFIPDATEPVVVQ